VLRGLGNIYQVFLFIKNKYLPLLVEDNFCEQKISSRNSKKNENRQPNIIFRQFNLSSQNSFFMREALNFSSLPKHFYFFMIEMLSTQILNPEALQHISISSLKYPKSSFLQNRNSLSS